MIPPPDMRATTQGADVLKEGGHQADPRLSAFIREQEMRAIHAQERRLFGAKQVELETPTVTSVTIEKELRRLSVL